MKITAATTLFATFLSFSTTAVAQGPGQACYYWDGATYGNVEGICGNPSTCEANMGYTVVGRCSGGADNRCCIRRGCVAGASGGRPGRCTTIGQCNSRPGFRRQAGYCPGPSDIQCCWNPSGPIPV
ncbi:hypothetical protein QBC34DRAFT_76188 [Podospora aff. communis PSN243]|uniref:Uncharacterized protein n=1 Tax=Podospora aff. communis PSN243 TaxID=3040156 RepID=A0AAV9GNX9_9PEZI|nr:hypothetical protein QBC34DRAFT_76188 [Podospora aff. communis PSN243]